MRTPLQEQMHLLWKDSPYQWQLQNEYQKFFYGFVHDQNIKCRLFTEKPDYKLRLDQNLLYKGKSYETFTSGLIWIMLRPDAIPLKDSIEEQKPPLTAHQKLAEGRAIGFSTCREMSRLEYRFGVHSNRFFSYNPFLSAETSNRMQEYSVSWGAIMRSQNANFHTELTGDSSSEFQVKETLNYWHSKFLLGLASKFSWSDKVWKIEKGLLGYQLSPKDHFYLDFNIENLTRILRGKSSYNTASFYYFRRFNEQLKVLVGVKALNFVDSTLNLGVEVDIPRKTQGPVRVKAKVDNRLNTDITVRYPFDFNGLKSYISYGISLTNAFSRSKRIQQGVVAEINI